jgi:tetratricopeptide (TPR) repeat protein
MSEHSVSLSSSGPPETILDPEPPDARAALQHALAQAPDERRDALAQVAARWPACLDAWSQLGEHARDDVEAYACFRVAYHRGLDRLRASGWRGSGYVRWRHETNRGFLRGLVGLGNAAARIGEAAEAQRCAEFAHQLDPELAPGRPLPSSP